MGRQLKIAGPAVQHVVAAVDERDLQIGHFPALDALLERLAY